MEGKITGPGWYERPAGWSGVVIGEGDVVKEITADVVLDKVIGQLDSIIETAERDITPEKEAATNDESQLVKILPGFPEKIQGEIVFCDADNISKLISIRCANRSEKR